MKIETDAAFYKTDEINYQRSSAIKSFESCSYLYYCQYILKIPQIDNQGALMGSVCHSFFECLLNPKRRFHFNKIIYLDSVKAIKSTERLVRKLIKKNTLPNTEEIFNKVNNMIMVGLKHDFYVDGGIIIGKEHRFKIINESPKYALYGTIDKIAEKGDYIIIYDYKSSKLKYSGEDQVSNIQALCYCLACKKLWPNKKVKLKFIFLQYPNDPIQEMEFSDEILLGFEHYLESTQKKFDSFTEKSAYLNFAADKDYPPDGHFGGKLCCGYGKFPGHTKKDGTPYWVCSFKFPRTYYSVKKNNKLIKNYPTKEEIVLKDGEIIEQVKFLGCPRYMDRVSEISKPKIRNNDINNLLDSLFKT